jgi:hypothetical protein
MFLGEIFTEKHTRGLFKKFPNFLSYARMLLRIDTMQVVTGTGIHCLLHGSRVIAVSSSVHVLHVFRQTRVTFGDTSECRV